MRSFLFDIATMIYLIPLFMGLSKYSSLNKQERTFLIFIIASAFCNLLAYVTSSLGNNLYVAYLFTTLEILILPHFLLSPEDRKRFKVALFSITGLLLGLTVFEAIAREGGIQKYNNLSLTFVALTASILSIRKLLKLRFDETIYNLAKSSVFWFTLGLGIYYLGNILIYAFLRLFQDQAPELLANLSYFRLVIVYISVALYIYGFVQIKSKTTMTT